MPLGHDHHPMNTVHWKILYLSQDPSVIRRQLAGDTLTREQAAPLRDDVSTDEITPVNIMSRRCATMSRPMRSRRSTS